MGLCENYYLYILGIGIYSTSSGSSPNKTDKKETIFTLILPCYSSSHLLQWTVNSSAKLCKNKVLVTMKTIWKLLFNNNVNNLIMQSRFSNVRAFANNKLLTL